jgi:hypothetical protein
MTSDDPQEHQWLDVVGWLLMLFGQLQKPVSQVIVESETGQLPNCQPVVKIPAKEIHKG